MATEKVVKIVYFEVGMSIEAEYENPSDSSGSIH